MAGQDTRNGGVTYRKQSSKRACLRHFWQSAAAGPWLARDGGQRSPCTRAANTDLNHLAVFYDFLCFYGDICTIVAPETQAYP